MRQPCCAVTYSVQNVIGWLQQSPVRLIVIVGGAICSRCDEREGIVSHLRKWTHAEIRVCLPRDFEFELISS